MGLYIEDDEKKTIRHYSTTPELEEAIEMLLQNDFVMWTESYEGYEIEYKEVNNGNDR